MTDSSGAAMTWSGGELTAFHVFLSGLVEEMDAEGKGVLSGGDGLLEGNWKGVAASKFVPGWEEWKEGWREVLDALKAEDELVVQSEAEYSRTEEENQTQLGQVAAGFNW